MEKLIRAAELGRQPEADIWQRTVENQLHAAFESRVAETIARKMMSSKN